MSIVNLVLLAETGAGVGASLAAEKCLVDDPYLSRIGRAGMHLSRNSA